MTAGWCASTDSDEPPRAEDPLILEGLATPILAAHREDNATTEQPYHPTKLGSRIHTFHYHDFKLQF